MDLGWSNWSTESRSKRMCILERHIHVGQLWSSAPVAQLQSWNGRTCCLVMTQPFENKIMKRLRLDCCETGWLDPTENAGKRTEILSLVNPAVLRKYTETSSRFLGGGK